MSEPHLSIPDGATSDDDLPRALKRERDAQQARAKAAAAAAELRPPRAAGVTVAALDIPFTHLALFFIKAALAALPALLLLAALGWGLGKVLSAFFPALVKLQILILVPG